MPADVITAAACNATFGTPNCAALTPVAVVPVAEINPAVKIFPCIALPALLIIPGVNIFPVVKLPIPPVILPVVESVTAAKVIVVTFDTVFIFIPLVALDHGIIENPTLP